MTTAGVRDLKNNLSRYLRRVAAGERILVTDHGRVVAELGPPPTKGKRRLPPSAIRPPLEEGSPVATWRQMPAIKLPRGTALRILNEDRGER